MRPGGTAGGPATPIDELHSVSAEGGHPIDNRSEDAAALPAERDSASSKDRSSISGLESPPTALVPGELVRTLCLGRP